ncbi:hypothetical protein EVAR_8683_1 [Eumeta japonica]|uniref:Uncharacterized protein n=1 Tax=Eumeta variegata TaxID=151549 RepID=A0A4C1TUK1_EUMVA|nr:hypothetical protein EVAR_8683_1 [Eumeta japonica]
MKALRYYLMEYLEQVRRAGAVMLPTRVQHEIKSTGEMYNTLTGYMPEVRAFAVVSFRPVSGFSARYPISTLEDGDVLLSPLRSRVSESSPFMGGDDHLPTF